VSDDLREQIERAIYDGVIGQWLPGHVRDALAGNMDPRPIAAALLPVVEAYARQQAAQALRDAGNVLAGTPSYDAKVLGRWCRDRAHALEQP
jgi:hypothetical protein